MRQHDAGDYTITPPTDRKPNLDPKRHTLPQPYPKPNRETHPARTALFAAGGAAVGKDR